MDYLANLALGPAELGSASIRTEGRGPEFLPGGSVQETEASVEKGGERGVGRGTLQGTVLSGTRTILGPPQLIEAQTQLSAERGAGKLHPGHSPCGHMVSN